MTRLRLISSIAFLLICAGCDSSPTTPSIPGPAFVTATLPPTLTPAFTAASPRPTLAPTIVPIPGVTTSEVNLREDTSTASRALGAIPAFSNVQIIGRDSSGLWYRILFNGNSGWVRADFVQAQNESAEIPILGAESESGSGVRGVITRGVNVRSGPGQDFESLGLLNQNDVVPIFGKDASGAWMKVAYPPAADGTGWVNAEFMQIENIDAIPTLGNKNPSTQTSEADSAEAPAPMEIAQNDNDSADAPIAVFSLSPASARSIQFEGDVSAPQGDGEDWIVFSADHDRVVIQLSCDSGFVLLEFIQSDMAPLECGGTVAMEAEPGKMYLMKISPVPTGDGIHADYKVRITVTID